jgi:hypothetical protein
MQLETHPASVSRRRIWVGRIISGLAVLFLLFDSVIKLMNLPPVVESFARLGYPVSLGPAIGTLELVLIALYLIPRTSILDAVFSHVLFPVYVGVVIWGGLYLRDNRLRALIAPRG